MTAIKIENLSFKYNQEDNENVLKNISLSIEQGEYVTIIGHNGSGKSTLAKLIIGLISAQSGSIHVFGDELNEKSVRDMRHKVGIVFQNPDNQFIGATVRDDIAFGLENHSVPQKDMDDIINEFAVKVNMSEFLDKEPAQLSGGQKQRVAIAGVLAMNPNVIIMDESTAMLDPRGKKEIIDLTKKIKESKPSLTVLSITHDIEEAYNADRVIVLNKGEILFNDTPFNVFKNHEVLRKIGLDIPFFDSLKIELCKNGMDVASCLNLEEIKEKLCQ